MKTQIIDKIINEIIVRGIKSYAMQYLDAISYSIFNYLCSHYATYRFV